MSAQLSSASSYQQYLQALQAGANTGLTGGSVPRSDSCDRPTVVINTRRLDKVVPLANGSQVLCLAGAGIYSLAETLKVPIAALKSSESP